MTVHVGTGNRAPAAENRSVRTRPDAEYTFGADDFGFTDPDGDALASVRIETLPRSDRGSLTLDGSAFDAGEVVARSDIDAGRLRYAPPAGQAGADFARFRFRVNDGTADSAEAYTMTVHIGNRAPAAADGSVRIRPDAEYTFEADDFGFTDPDGDALASVRIETLPASGRGTLTLGGSAVAAGRVVPRGDIDAGRLRYAPPAGETGEDFASFTFRVNDGTADSADAYTMTVHVGNRAPVAADSSVSTGANTRYAFGVGDFGYSDADGDALAGIAIRAPTRLPAGSALRLDGAPVAAGQEVTRAQLEAGGLVFTPATGGAGSPYASFAFTVSDGFADSAPATMSVHVVDPTGERAVGAWIARFGRTVAEQVLEAVEGRVRAAGQPGASLELGGRRIGLASPSRDGASEYAPVRGFGARPARVGATRTMNGGELLLGSSFSLTGQAAGGGSASFWGRGAVSRFEGRESGLAVDGDATGALLGGDWQRGGLTAGLIVAHNRGEGGYRESGGGAARGTVEATLTGAYPWLRHALGDRLEAWGVAGYGGGKLTLEPDAGQALRADLASWMAATGLRGTLLDPGGEGLRLTARTGRHDCWHVDRGGGLGGRSAGGRRGPGDAASARAGGGAHSAARRRLGADAGLRVRGAP